MSENRSATPPLARRRVVLGAVGAILGGLAGCTTEDADGPAGSTDSPSDSTSATTASTATDDETTPDSVSGESTNEETASGTTESDSSPATTASELDLREANVVEVAFEQLDGSYRFSVTLFHDDDGEAGYADWWQVETTDGEQLGRRELLHAHGTEPFTRSETIEIPPDVTCVVVRGHDQTHGYGGRALVLGLDSGAILTIEQGFDRRAIDPSECP